MQMNLFDNDIFDDVAPHIVKAFWKYHEENSHVWDLFVKFARDVHNAGRKRYGVVAISERIRWHIDIETKGDSFKLNNNYRSCYARLLISKFPEYRDLFEIRRTPGTIIEEELNGRP